MEYESGRSKGQYSILVIVMAISASLSALASFAVTRIAYLKMTSTYQRFLYMLSTANVVNSLFLIFHQFVVPESEDFYWAGGNIGSCSMAGFFLHFGALSLTMYHCYISVYFFCSIQSSPKREKQPEDIIGVWEWLAHISCVALPTGIVGAAAGTGNIDLNEGLGLCSIYSYECQISTNLDCGSRGSSGVFPKENNLFFWLWLSALSAFAFVGIMATILVYVKVQSTLTKGGSAFDGALSDEMKQRLRAVSTQAILYTGIFVVAFVFPVLAGFIRNGADEGVFGLLILAYFFYPVQGVFSCLIYIRPRYQMLRAMYPEDSMLVVFRVSMSRAGDPEEIEDVREQIYGDAYEPPPMDDSDGSLGTDIPEEVSFDPVKPLSATSLVSVPADDDDMDPEANTGKRVETKEEEADEKSG